MLIVALAAGSIVEKLHGSDFARSHVYGAWWFVALWGVFLVIAALLAFRNGKWKCPTAAILFLSVACILLGGLLTMLRGQHGKMLLEPDKPQSHFFIKEQGKITKEALPFSLVLKRFELETYPNSSKPKDYVSHIFVHDGDTSKETAISMNNILKINGYRFIQSDYDEKGNSILAVTHDPWGIGVTYAGYALLFIGLATMLIRRKSVRAVTVSWLSVLVVLTVTLHIRMLVRPLMPVLRSPLFSLHIATIVTAYALLAGIVVVGAVAVVKRLAKPSDSVSLGRLKAVSMAMLHPAVALLAVGVGIGAVWANISWGNYWSWDPKEVWALITLLIYAMPLLPDLMQAFRKPMFFHVYGILAFLSVLITYFGVNLILGGIHAYN